MFQELKFASNLIFYGLKNYFNILPYLEIMYIWNVCHWYSLITIYNAGGSYHLNSILGVPMGNIYQFQIFKSITHREFQKWLKYCFSLVQLSIDIIFENMYRQFLKK